MMWSAPGRISYISDLVAGQDELSPQSTPHHERPESIDIDDSYREENTALQVLCENVTTEDPESWNAVREWFGENQPDDLRMAAEHVGEFNNIALHLACRKRPPLDVVKWFLRIAPETLEWTDSFGWLPLHHACAYGATDDVLQLLVEFYPFSATSVDIRERTPLHFALGNIVRPATVNAMVLLTSTGAASCPDRSGMLPLHHACAYGASEDALRVLIDAFPESVTAADGSGRTPLHFAMGNCDRKSSPAVTKLLLSKNKKIVNLPDKYGHIPLNLLTSRAATIGKSKEKEREYTMQCLDLYINASPVVTADFFITLISLPDWLRDFVVVKSTVQDMLNEKITERFPSWFLIMDLYSRLVLIYLFYTAAWRYLHDIAVQNQDDEQNDDQNNKSRLGFYYGIMTCTFYILFREILQIVSLLALNSVESWFRDVYNILNVGTFLLPTILTIIMWTESMMETTDQIDKPYIFRFLSVATVLLLWLSLLFTLRSTLLHLAVFIGGLIRIVRNLFKFLITLIIISCAFTNIFFLLGIFTDRDTGENSWIQSFLHVYTMLLGEVDDIIFVQKGPAAVFQFCLFFFLVVIILGNILIATVTDSYSYVRDERAAVVFWNNRLNFVAEMNAISFLCCGHGEKNTEDQREAWDGSYLRDLWNKLGKVFEDKHLSTFSLRCLVFTAHRCAAAMVMIIIIIAGFLTAGFLWPSQIREYFFVGKTSKMVDLKEEQKVSKEVKLLKSEFKQVQDHVVQERTEEREELNELKNLITSMKWDMQNEMKEMKEAVELLFTELVD